jgi:hypothetical protein
VASQGNNISNDSTCSLTGPGDRNNIDPRLGPLANNGGQTDTHALLADSPAVDAGSNTGCPATDQRGVARPIDGTGRGVAICDIGAVEYQPPPFAATRTPTPTVTPARTVTATPTATGAAPRTATATPTATPGSLSVGQAIAQVQGTFGLTGQTGVPSADTPGEQVTVSGSVSGMGRVLGSMAWTLTATVPAGVAPGTVPVAVVATTAGLQGFACAPVAAGAGTVGCGGTTGANALQGSTVVVVFGPGRIATGTVTGPGPRALLALPLLPPPPPLVLPPGPPAVAAGGPLVAGRPGGMAPVEVPVIPEAASGWLLLAGLGALLLATSRGVWRRSRRARAAGSGETGRGSRPSGSGRALP